MTVTEEEAQRVLVVDDEKSNRQLLSDLLRADYKVLLAKNGEQALERATADPPPDLILLDVLMPDMDGYAVLHRLNQDPKTQDIPVIFVTGLSEEADEEKGLELGAVDYVTKPFRPAIIRARVRNHLTYVWQRKALEHLAQIDSLTGVANRRRFDEALDRMWRHAQRHDQALSVAMLDIDCFKQYNDHFGHGPGDEALKGVARTLQESAQRPYDLVARYGGEEFVVLLPGLEVGEGRAFAETLLADIRGLEVPHAPSVGGIVTASLGGATAYPHHWPQDNPERLVKDADQALYTAKADGRDRVAWR